MHGTLLHSAGIAIKIKNAGVKSFRELDSQAHSLDRPSSTGKNAGGFQGPWRLGCPPLQDVPQRMKAFAPG